MYIHTLQDALFIGYKQSLENARCIAFSQRAQSSRCDSIEGFREDHSRLLNQLSPKILSDEAHFWLNGYVNKQNCRIWSEANPQVYVETPLHPEKLTVWCALWAGGILLQKR
ncbi:hypothetical protein TNCV_1114151 [Trichonephila clavipes]|nr:hypothetical protein TNCV_1114151 [Trichonephila clavipes]